MSNSRVIKTWAAWGLALAGGLAVPLIAAAPAHAGGLTNPAQHQSEIHIFIDGQEYIDGLDTVPGYDDYECTSIPGAYNDYANNKVIYYNTDKGTVSIPWTEWERFGPGGDYEDPRYDKYLASKNAGTSTPGGSNGSGSGGTTSGGTSTGGSGATPTSGSGTTPTTGSGTGAGGKSSGGSGSSQSGGQKHATHSDSDVTGVSPTLGAAADPSPAAAIGDIASPTPDAGGAVLPGDSATVSAAPAAHTLDLDVGAGPGDTRTAGAVILAALGLAGIALLIGQTLFKFVPTFTVGRRKP